MKFHRSEVPSRDRQFGLWGPGPEIMVQGSGGGNLDTKALIKLIWESWYNLGIADVLHAVAQNISEINLN